MYSAVLFGWPLTTINPMRLTSTPTDSILVASTISMARVSPFSQVGLNLTSSWSSFLGISLFATREVSSSTMRTERWLSPGRFTSLIWTR